MSLESEYVLCVTGHILVLVAVEGSLIDDKPFLLLPFIDRQ